MMLFPFLGLIKNKNKKIKKGRLKTRKDDLCKRRVKKRVREPTRLKT